MSSIAAATPVIWNNIKIEYVGQTLFDYSLDGKDRNAMVKFTNIGTQAVNNLNYQIAIVGLGNYPATTGDGGFAVFPNGGNIDLAPGESYIAQNWLSGIYEGRFSNQPPASGTSKTYTFDFLIATDNAVFHQSNPLADSSKAAKLQQQIQFDNFTYNNGLSGPMAIRGTIANTNLVDSDLTVEIATPYSSWYSVTTTQSGNSATFSANVPDRDDWIIRISGSGIESQTIKASDINAHPTSLAVALEVDTAPIPDGYSVLATDDAPTGFWKGDVSESQRTFVLIPGQENWAGQGNDNLSRSYRQASEVRKYDFNGNLLWSHNIGWEAWGGDMSADGSKVVYLINPTVTSYATPEWELGMLDGNTGNLLWSVSGADRLYLAGLEAAISDDGRYVAAGSTTGSLGLMNAANGQELWTKPHDTFGQVRKLVFSGDYLYVGTGDGFLYKLAVSNGNQVWKTYVGGWPFVNGLQISDDGSMISVGTKSKDTTLINANTGAVLWSHQTGALDAVISADGNYVANFYGDIFSAATGELVGQTNVAGTVLFSDDSQSLIQADRGLITVSDLTGNMINRYEDRTDTEHGGGEQAQWTYLTEDGTRLIVASRDMDTPGERALTIWQSIEGSINSGSSGNTPNSPGNNTGGSVGGTSGTAADDVLMGTAGNDMVRGGDGLDRLVMGGNIADYAVTRSGDITTLTRAGGGEVDTLDSVERVSFNDFSLALDTDGTAGIAYRIYKAAFDRTPDTWGLGYWLNQMDHGQSLPSVATGFVGSAEFQQMYGTSISDARFVQLLYNNVLNRDPDQSGYDYWQDKMERGLSRPDVLAYFSESTENINNVAAEIANGITYEAWVG